jgi:autotransporter-associated beta strand protein
MIPSKKTTVVAALLAAAGSLSAQTTWTGGGLDDFWSTGPNWSTGTAPGTTTDVIFGNTDKTTSATPNSVVSTSGTIRSLLFNNIGSTANDWQNVEIASGQVLSINNSTTGSALLVASGTATTTLAKITGSGTLAINGGTTANMVLTGTQGAGGNAYSSVMLDLSGLSGFTATLNNLSVGGSLAGLSTLNLASSNSITANTVTVGSTVRATGAGSGSNSVLNLGAQNAINANTLVIGAVQARTGGSVQFAAPGGSVTIRGRSGGISRADLTIGTGGDGSANLVNVVNFNGSTVDALFNNMNVGNAATGNGTTTGNFSMDAGTVDANSVLVGSRTGNGSGAATGNLNVSGGTLLARTMTIASQAATATSTANGTLNVSGSAAVQVGTSGTNANLVMGNVTGVVNLTSNAVVNVTGGSLTVFGNIAEGTNAGTGTINSTVTLNGGLLNLTGHNISVDTFNAQSGTLSNVAQFNSGANLIKTTAGTLILDGANTYTGSTLVNAGTVLLADNASLTFYIGATGVNNSFQGTGVLNLDGDFVFDLAGAASVGSWTIVDVASLTETYGSTFTVQGFTETSSGVWESGGYTFTEATGILTAVPEPSISLLAAFGLAGVCVRRRSRK